MPLRYSIYAYMPECHFAHVTVYCRSNISSFCYSCTRDCIGKSYLLLVPIGVEHVFFIEETDESVGAFVLRVNGFSWVVTVGILLKRKIDSKGLR